MCGRYSLTTPAEAMARLDVARLKASLDAGADNEPASPVNSAGGQDPICAAHVSLERTAMEVDGRTIDRAPGMAVTAEIETGTRRVIEYLPSPALRYKQESLRER